MWPGAAVPAAAVSATGLHSAAAAQPPAYHWHLPRGFPVPAVPPDNPMSDAKVALGRRLFFETRLSVTGHYSCSSCHDPAHAFTDGRARAVGATGATLPHSAMALVNVAYNLTYGWTDPGVTSLESQMLQPLLNQHPVELGLKGRQHQVAAQLARDPSYRRAFAAAFPGARPVVTFAHIVKAIAAFERTLISGDSPFDRYVFGGDETALSTAAKRGMDLFFSSRLGCSSCHSGFNFAGNWRDSRGATGRPSFANDGTSARPLRVPTLRNIALTAPYMHDGRFATLDAVIDHYIRAGHRAARTPHAQHPGPRLRSFTLSPRQRRQLIAFLDSLTDEAFIERYTVAGHSR